MKYCEHDDYSSRNITLKIDNFGERLCADIDQDDENYNVAGIPDS